MSLDDNRRMFLRLNDSRWIRVVGSQEDGGEEESLAKRFDTATDPEDVHVNLNIKGPPDKVAEVMQRFADALLEQNGVSLPEDQRKQKVLGAIERAQSRGILRGKRGQIYRYLINHVGTVCSRSDMFPAIYGQPWDPDGSRKLERGIWQAREVLKSLGMVEGANGWIFTEYEEGYSVRSLPSPDPFDRAYLEQGEIRLTEVPNPNPASPFTSREFT